MKGKVRTLGASLVLVTLAGAGAIVVAEPAWSPVEPRIASPESGETRSRNDPSQDGLRVGKPGSGKPGPLSPAQKRAISQGYLVPDQDAYERAKARAAEKARKLSGEGLSSPEIRAPR